MSDRQQVSDRPRFAHASEAELARILDYYDVSWQYEPRTFPIQWNLDGAVVESFTPDFYLQDLDLYVELTTLRQSLVRRKNRKLRRLRELYPDVRIKLFYGKDFRALMLKYGRFDLAASLSGLEGQSLADASYPGRVTELAAEPALEGTQAREQPTSQPSPTVAQHRPGDNPAAEGQPAEGQPAEGQPAEGQPVQRPPAAGPRARRASRGSRRRKARRMYRQAVAADGA